MTSTPAPSPDEQAVPAPAGQPSPEEQHVVDTVEVVETNQPLDEWGED